MNKTQLARALFDAGDFQAAIETSASDLEGLLLKASSLYDAGKYREGREVLGIAGPLIDLAEPRLKARFHGMRAAFDTKLGNDENVLVDYEAAKYWAEDAGDELCYAMARNNIAKQYAKAGRTDEALEESRAAISTAKRLNEHAFIGRFLDQRAQILFKLGRFTEAVDTAKQAVETLEKHGNETTLAEAQTTYGKALVRLGSSYLISDSIDGYLTRKEVGLATTLDKELIHQALERSNGRVYQAAKLLDVSHSYIIKIAGNENLTRQPRRTRHKSLPVKAK